MTHTNKPLSLSDIHDVYNGAPKKNDTSETAPNYRKSDRFAREPGHPGVARNRPPTPPGRKAR